MHRVIWDPLGVWPSGRRLIWATFAVLAIVNLGPGFADAMRPGPDEGVDFFQEWASAKNVLRREAVYSDLEHSARVYLGYTLAPGEEMRIRINAHPPTSVLTALPFAHLDYPNATLAWNLVSLLALVLSLWMLARGLAIRPEPWAIIPAVTLGMLSSPLRQQVNHAQFNLILLCLLTLLWLTERSGRSTWAGVALGTATAIKLFPAFLFLYFILRRRWDVVVSALAALAALTLGTVAILGLGTYTAYIKDVMPQVSIFRSWWPNASLAGFWIKWFDTGAVCSLADAALVPYLPPLVQQPALAKIGWALSGLAILVLWGRAVRRAQTRGEQDWAFGLTLTAMLLLSPLTWDHYFLLILLPLAQLWIALSSARRARVLLLLLVICIWANPYDVWTAFIPPPGSPATPVRSLIVVSYQFFALLGLFVLAVRESGGGPRHLTART